MKRIETSLNKEQYKRVARRCEKKGVTVYAYLKALVLKDLSEG